MTIDKASVERVAEIISKENVRFIAEGSHWDGSQATEACGASFCLFL